MTDISGYLRGLADLFPMIQPEIDTNGRIIETNAPYTAIREYRFTDIGTGIPAPGDWHGLKHFLNNQSCLNPSNTVCAECVERLPHPWQCKTADLTAIARAAIAVYRSRQRSRSSAWTARGVTLIRDMSTCFCAPGIACSKHSPLSLGVIPFRF